MKQAEEVRSEQQAAIEDLVKAEANHTAEKKTVLATPAAAVEEHDVSTVKLPDCYLSHFRHIFSIISNILKSLPKNVSF